MFGHGSSAFSSNNSIEVIDPCNRTGKIVLPNRHVHETRGVQLWRDSVAAKRAAGVEGRSTKVLDLSLCLLFQKGKCNAGSRCNQVHADPSYVEELRQKASTACNCCGEHGDVHSVDIAALSTTVIFEDMPSEGKTSEFPIKSCARTKALEFFMRQATRSGELTIKIPAAKICRLHAQNRCKFGRDCKNIHLCHKATPMQKNKTPVATPESKFLSLEPKTEEKKFETAANSSFTSLSAVTQAHPAESSLEGTPLPSVSEKSLEPSEPSSESCPPPLLAWVSAKNPLSVSDAWDFNVLSLTQPSSRVTIPASRSNSSTCAPLDAEECSFSQKDLEAFVADLTNFQPSPLFVSPQFKQ